MLKNIEKLKELNDLKIRVAEGQLARLNKSIIELERKLGELKSKEVAARINVCGVGPNQFSAISHSNLSIFLEGVGLTAESYRSEIRELQIDKRKSEFALRTALASENYLDRKSQLIAQSGRERKYSRESEKMQQLHRFFKAKL